MYKVFPTGEMGGESPQPAKNLLISTHLEKCPTSRPRPPPNFYPLPPLSNNFRVITQ